MQTEYQTDDLDLSPEEIPYFDLATLEAGLEERPNPESESEEGWLHAIRDFYREIKSRQLSIEEIYQPAGEWREHVENHMPHYSAFHGEPLSSPQQYGSPKGCERRLPASPSLSYPFPEGSFKQIYKRYDMFQKKYSGRGGDYREFLYQKIPG